MKRASTGEVIDSNACMAEIDRIAAKTSRAMLESENNNTRVIPIPQTIPTSLLTTKCGTCHGGDAPKKGLLLDGTAKLTCEQMARAMKRVQDGSMPPKGTLTGEERGDVFQELLDLVETK